jgi:indolepyruvate ferredoxin oxidoreductase beta subunit
VQSHLRLADTPIASDLIPIGSANMILAVEPLEALRYLPYLAADGWLVSNDQPVENIPNYPPLERVYAEIRRIRNHLLFNAVDLAKTHGSPKAVNVAMLGAAAPFLQLTLAEIEAAITDQFCAKGEQVVAANLVVFRAACNVALSARGCGAV